MSQQVGISRSSRYAPIRYEATRPYAKRIGKMFAAEARKGEAERLAFVSDRLFRLIDGEINRLGYPSGPGPTQGEIGNVQIYGEYQDGGRIIFDVRKELSKSLLVTDCREISCDSIVFPARSFYLHFGPGTGLVENGMMIEGAFVQDCPEEKALLVDLVAAGAFAVEEFWRLPMGEQLTGIRVDLSQPEMSISAALDSSIDIIIGNNNKFLQQTAEIERELSVQYGRPIRVPSPVENIADKRELLHSAMQLVINTLFFLSAEPRDVQEDWEASVPAKLLEKLQSPKQGIRISTEKKLLNSGYVKVRFVGRDYAGTLEGKAVAAAMGPGRTMPTHLRRGHFRSQPYGPERALRKTVFIAPVVVNPGKGETPGRIYEV